MPEFPSHNGAANQQKEDMMKRIIGVLIAGIFVTACANKAGETSETPHQMVDSTKVVITEINAADLPASVATLVKTT